MKEILITQSRTTENTMNRFMRTAIIVCLSIWAFSCGNQSNRWLARVAPREESVKIAVSNIFANELASYISKYVVDIPPWTIINGTAESGTLGIYIIPPETPGAEGLSKQEFNAYYDRRQDIIVLNESVATFVSEFSASSSHNRLLLSFVLLHELGHRTLHRNESLPALAFERFDLIGSVPMPRKLEIEADEFAIRSINQHYQGDIEDDLERLSIMLLSLPGGKKQFSVTGSLSHPPMLWRVYNLLKTYVNLYPLRNGKSKILDSVKKMEAMNNDIEESLLAIISPENDKVDFEKYMISACRSSDSVYLLTGDGRVIQSRRVTVNGLATGSAVKTVIIGEIVSKGLFRPNRIPLGDSAVLNIDGQLLCAGDRIFLLKQDRSRRSPSALEFRKSSLYRIDQKTGQRRLCSLELGVDNPVIFDNRVFYAIKLNPKKDIITIYRNDLISEKSRPIEKVSISDLIDTKYQNISNVVFRHDSAIFILATKVNDRTLHIKVKQRRYGHEQVDELFSGGLDEFFSYAEKLSLIHI